MKTGDFARIDEEEEPVDEEAMIYGHLSLARNSQRSSESQSSLQNREQQPKAQMSDAFIRTPKSTEKNQSIPKQYYSEIKRLELHQNSNWNLKRGSDFQRNVNGKIEQVHFRLLSILFYIRNKIVIDLI